MSRSLRIEFPGAYYHVLSRGNNRYDIFKKGEDYQGFLDRIEVMSSRFSIDIYAFVLMTNHYHLLLRTREANLSKAMQWLGSSYTRYFNTSNRQDGHLFQGRFKSILVENDSYFVNLSCYIHRNPLRAKMVSRLTDYKWSSYSYYAYGKERPGWLDVDTILKLNGGGEDRHRIYREKVQQYSDEDKSIWEDVKFGLIFGSQRFIDHIKKEFTQRQMDKELPGLNHILKDKDPEILAQNAADLMSCDLELLRHKQRLSGDDLVKRDIITRLLWETGMYNNRQIGETLGISYSAVSKRLNHISRMIKDPDHSAVKNQYNNLKALVKV